MQAVLGRLVELQGLVLGYQDALAACRREGDQLRAMARQQEALAAAQADQLRAQTAACQAAHSEAVAQLTAQAAELDRLQRQVQGLEGELARIHASRGWRALAPLRRMRAWFKGPR